MSSIGLFMEVKTKSENVALREFRKRRKYDLYEFGHDSYSGTFGTFTGVRLQLQKVFSSRADAEKYILEHDTKWGDAIGVTVKENGKSYVLIGGWAAT